MSESAKPSLYGLSLERLRDALSVAKLPRFSSDQIYNWIYRRHEYDLENWTNVSKKVKKFLTENYDLSIPKIVWSGLSKDGTRKFLVAMKDGNTVETVMIPAKERRTLCISSQVGCAIGCTFCHTGTMGLTRHLTDGEITGQLLAVAKWIRKEEDNPEFRMSNIVFMGQGEPLHNYDAVKAATEVFLEDRGFGIGQRRITLSTSGLVPQIEKLWDFPPVNIAISLHAAHDDIRTELMPINKAYDLKKLFEAIRTIPLKATRRITYEYLLIDGLNDREEDLAGLEKLLTMSESKINIIPFNEYPESKFKRPSNAKIVWFQDQLIKRGYVCTTRVAKGDDILAACGQLKSMEEDLNLWDKVPTRMFLTDPNLPNAVQLNP